MAKLELLDLEDRCTPATITVTNINDTTAIGDGVSLREAIYSVMQGSKLNNDVVAVGAYGIDDTIVFSKTLSANSLTVSTRDPASNFGSSAFAITKSVSIIGDSSTGFLISRDTSSSVNLRFFDVQSTGALSLQNITLVDGIAQGGNGANGGGGAAGMGGAIFNQGLLSLNAVTLAGNQAIGGNGAVGDSTLVAGNVFGGGGGVGGDGTPGTLASGAQGNGGSPLGGRAGTSTINGGLGGGGAAQNGIGGFGGGGAAGPDVGTGGYGGGGGGSLKFTTRSVYGGGDSLASSNGVGGGGGAGMGGAIFNAGGVVQMVNVTISNNSATGGMGAAIGTNAAQYGAALGGGVYNLNGTVISVNTTFAYNELFAPTVGTANGLTAAGSDIYNHQFSSTTGMPLPANGNPAQLGLLNIISASSIASITGTVTTAGIVNTGGTISSTSTGNVVTQADLGTGFKAATISGLALGTVTNNGGPVETISIGAASAARQAGVATGAPTTDARGEIRPTTDNVDAGAYQFKVPQVITLNVPSVVSYGVAPIALSATGGGSNNPITFTLISGPATLAGNTLTVTGVGTIRVQAIQQGDATYAATSAPITITVNPATLTYVATKVSRAYGTVNPTVTGTVTGFVNGETLQSVTTGTMAFATTAQQDSDVGSYAITGTGLSASNYVLVQDPGNATAFTINPVALTVTPTSFTRIAGQQDDTLRYTATGFVNGETASVLTGALATTATTFSPPGTYPITIGTLSATNYTINLASAALTVVPNTQVVFAVSSGDDSRTSVVRIFDNTGAELAAFLPFDNNTSPNGARVAMADVNNDGFADVIVGTGPGVPTQVKVFDGVSFAQVFTISPFESAFTGGVYVAGGDLNGDGYADLVITPDEGGGPRARVFSGKNFSQMADFFGIEDTNFRGGVRPAIGNISGNGEADLIIAAGFGGGPRVAIFNAAKIASEGTLADQSTSRWNTWKVTGDFLAFEPELRNGAFVAAGDVNGDGYADLVAGAGPDGGPRVSVFSGMDLLDNKQTRIADFFGGDVNNRSGIRVAAKDFNSDGKADIIVGPGPGAGAKVSAYSATSIANPTPPSLFTVDPFPGFDGGVFVG